MLKKAIAYFESKEYDESIKDLNNVNNFLKNNIIYFSSY